MRRVVIAALVVLLASTASSQRGGGGDGSQGERPRATGRVSRDGPRPTGRVSAERPRATGRVSRDGPRATARVSRDGPRPTGRISAEGPRATARVSRDGPRATARVSRDGPRPTGRVSAEGPRATGRVSRDGPRPTARVSRNGPRPTGRVSAEGPRATARVSRDGPRATGRVSRDGPRPTGRVSADGPRPTARVSRDGPRPTGRVSAEGPRATARVSRDGPRPTARVSRDGPRPTARPRPTESPKDTTPDKPLYTCATDDDCFKCSESGSECQTCQNGKYLQDGMCLEQCDGLVPVGNGRKNLRCVAPFTCKKDDESCECPGGCDECTVGVDGAVCTSCANDRFPVNGKCRKEVWCIKRKIDDTDLECECKSKEVKNCQTCKLTGGMESPVVSCTRCKNSKVFKNGVCGEATSCGAGEIAAGASAYGRVCTKPFTCKSGKTQGGDRAGKSCTCPDKANCQTCDWTERGPQCTRCRNKMYLHEGECVKACPRTDKLSSGGAGGYGRTCEPSFSCVKGKHSVTGEKCKCPDKQCKSCTWKNGNEPGVAVCDECQGSKVINDKGVCAKKKK